MEQDRSTRASFSREQESFGPLQHFYVLEPTPCPYLPNRLERKLLTEIHGPQARSGYDHLAPAGFRRSHRFAYRPACADCNACVPVRVVVSEFKPGKSLRRIARANADLSVELVAAKANQEQFDLFRRYIASRHGDGEMAGMSLQEYQSMVESSDVDTLLAEFRDASGRLIAVCLLDWLRDGPSAVYSFFEPGESGRSLGTYVVLWLIDEAGRRSKPHVYLGYWINQSRKMAYKTRFRPLEGLGTHGWELIVE
ncbi:arginyltransferase [Pelagibius litoralis]|uniref:Aspartate/glutamate leucyltransferase n=2 Tax=Pelagibius litoralis TaxID=374515 RepID=A0A967EUH5_9PROT|nr:arginyltransferase [Pelagibius litoralis]